MFCREYSEYLFGAEKDFKEYTEESDLLIMKHVKFSDFYKNLTKETISNLLDFMFECDFLARKMSCKINFSYSKKLNCVGASLLCGEISLCQDEIEAFIKLCAFSSHINFFVPDENEAKEGIVEFMFDLSGSSFTLANLIKHISAI